MGTCRGLHTELTSRGLNPISPGPNLSHSGMAGTLFRDPNSTLCPFFAAPTLPHLNLNDSALRDTLIDDWSKQIRDIRGGLKIRFGDVDIAFEFGGIAPLPDWHKKWCRQQGIGIMLFEPNAPKLTSSKNL